MDRAGLVGEDGTSHQGMFTIPAQRQLPNIVVASPKDEHSWMLLGLAYQQRARETGDPSYYAKSQGALDRVTIPEETSQRLAELAWVGASVIISDNGISGETGDTTDFIILTRPKSRSR